MPITIASVISCEFSAVTVKNDASKDMHMEKQVHGMEEEEGGQIRKKEEGKRTHICKNWNPTPY